MHRLVFRPLRLIRIKTDHLAPYSLEIGQNGGENLQDLPSPTSGQLYLAHNPSTPLPGIPAEQGEAGGAAAEKGDIPALASERSAGEAEASNLLKRAPHSYLFNQMYGLWFFISWFLLTILITRSVTPDEYGVFAIVLTAYNTILYIVAFGLEDAITTFVPRVLAEHGSPSAAQLTRRLLIGRLALLALSMVVILFALPVLASLVSLLPGQNAIDIAKTLRDPLLLNHVVPISIYVVGSSIGSLLTAVCAGLMRMRLVFVIGSLTQLALLGIGFLVLHLGWGVNGMLWLLAISSLFNAAAFAIWQAPFLFQRGSAYSQPLKPVIALGISAWLTNLVTGALLKQVSIIMLRIFAVAVVQIGFFNLSFQLADAANLLFVAGFGGVAGSALAAAFVGKNYDRLSLSWQTLIKIETLLAAPGLVFCLFNAPNIAHALYGSQYDAVGPLLTIFLFFNIGDRVMGRTIHQFALYVTGGARLVVMSQWIGMVAVVVIGALLIGYFKMGAVGALIADGVSRLVTGGLQLFFLWPHLPHRYPLGFTLRFLLAVTLAALPSLLWHPSEPLLLIVSGCIFVVLCIGLLLVIRPLTARDLHMLREMNPRLAGYLYRFARNPQVGKL